MFEAIEYTTLVGQELPELENISALVNSDPQAKINLSDFKGKWGCAI